MSELPPYLQERKTAFNALESPAPEIHLLLIHYFCEAIERAFPAT